MKNISKITSYFIMKYNNSKKNNKKNKIEYKQETEYKQEIKETKEASCQCDLMFLSYGVSTGF